MHGVDVLVAGVSLPTNIFNLFFFFKYICVYFAKID